MLLAYNKKANSTCSRHVNVQESTNQTSTQNILTSKKTGKYKVTLVFFLMLLEMFDERDSTPTSCMFIKFSVQKERFELEKSIKDCSFFMEKRKRISKGNFIRGKNNDTIFRFFK